MPDESISLKLDRERRARFTVASVLDLERESGKSLDKLEDGSITYIVMVLWSAIRTYEPKLTFQEFQRQLQDVTFPELTKALHALTPQLGKVLGVAVPAAPGTGQASDGLSLADAVTVTPSSTA